MKIYTYTQTVQWISDFAGDGAECLETGAKSFRTSEERDAALKEAIGDIVALVFQLKTKTKKIYSWVNAILKDKTYSGNMRGCKDIYEYDYEQAKALCKWSTFEQEI